MSKLAVGNIRHVILTLNLPEAEPDPPPGGWPFEITIVRNVAPKGFAANHNSAFVYCNTDIFCILNPDIRMLSDNPFEEGLKTLSQPNCGLAYVKQIGRDGIEHDYKREIPTPFALIRRWILNKPQQRIDWVSGAFMMIRSETFRSVNGLNECFYMYCEDTDFCLRIRAKGLDLCEAPATILHEAHHSSRKKMRHLYWHISSLIRLWVHLLLRRYRKI
ncbi:galactosyltransferase-related protein [Imbroritus primus]|uniref:galactosyltransferase-related protein n=1 Tax=Imbroritus primus TaxID=3058603 RepID=UPI003D160DB7